MKTRSVRCGVAMAFAVLMSAICLLKPGTAAAEVTNGPAFTILNKSGLTASQAKFYYLGYGSINNEFYVLMQDGTWKKAASGTAPSGSTVWDTGWNPTGWNPQSGINNQGGPTGSGVIPCHALNATSSSGPAVYVPLWSGSGANPKQAPSMRIYFFQVNYGSTFFNKRGNTPCNSVQSSSQTKGVFGNYFEIGSKKRSQYPFAYFSITDANGQLSGASIKLLKDNNKPGYGALPPWSFVEIGSGPDSATVDTSQVDFIGFAMNVTAKVADSPPAVGSYPKWNQGVGFAYSATGAVNMANVLNSYKSFVRGLQGRDKASYGLLRYKAGKDTVLLNPGNYLGQVNSRAFSTHFLDLVNNYLWKPGWTGNVYTGGALGAQAPLVPSATFTGKTVQLSSYPGYKGRVPLYAIEFKAVVGNPLRTLKAYVLSPSSYQTLCKANVIGYLPPPAARANGGGSCNWMSPAYQIFATDGALNTPRTADPSAQFDLLSATEQQVWNENYGGVVNYNAVVSRLGFMISMAFNHGVAGGLQTPGGLCEPQRYNNRVSECWNDQTLWYPQQLSRNDKTKYFNGDTTQNQFANWLHTAQINNEAMMTQPAGAVTSAAGKVMGMGYGFAADENPTPPNPAGTDAQTPSKYDGNVDMQPPAGCNFIAIMPWAAGIANPSPVVNAGCKTASGN